MTAKNPQPSDAPKVQIETVGMFGQPTVKQIELDTNRLRVKTESLQRFSNMVAVPSRGIFLDALMWVFTTAVLLRWALSLAITFGGLQLLGLAWGILILSCGFPLVVVFMQVPELRIDCFARFCMINAGFALATDFLWFNQWWPL
ncbi:MAG: hypothetical protein AAF215_31510 [Cyanobacteria bacterium P01_A01_bin.123]